MKLVVSQSYWHPKHGTLIVAKTSPALVRVHSPGQDPEDGFWLKPDDLSELPIPKEARVAQLEMQYAPGSEAALVAQLEAAGYRLCIRVPNEEELDRAEVEYLAWAGESLPNDSVYIRPYDKHISRGHEDKFRREWRLCFKLGLGMVLPFRVVPIGFSSGVVKNRYSTADDEQGLLRPNGDVEVNWTSIIARLVRVGLRVTPIRPKGQPR